MLAMALALAGPAAAQGGSGPAAFKIEELNSGLEPPKAQLDRSTPQAALEAYFTAIGRSDLDRAAHLLDLDAFPPEEQQSEGPELARKLAQIIQRKIPLDIESVPDRPDAMETVGTSREPMVGEPRKSVRLGSLELGRWPIAIRLNRVQVGEEAPVWVFSRQTVEHINPLYDRYGPTPFEKMLPSWLRGAAFFGLLWWEVFALPIILGLALSAGMLAWRGIGMASRVVPHDGIRDGLIRVRLPLVFAMAGIVLHALVANVFVFSAGADATLSMLFWLLVIIAIVMAASRVLDTIIDYTSERYLDTIDKPENTGDRDWYTNLSAVKRIGVLGVIVIGVAMAISSLDLFSSFGMSLLVSAGVATAVLGIAAQAMIGNILASIQLAVAKPLRIGDAIYFEDHWAYVERINYTYVQLRTWDQKRFIVPVRNFVATSFENWTMSNPTMIMPVRLKLDHCADVDKLREFFAEIAKEDEDWSEDAEAMVQAVGQDEDGIDVRFYCTADNPTAAWNLHCRAREKLMARIRDEHPEFLPRERIAAARAGSEDSGTDRRDADVLMRAGGRG